MYIIRALDRDGNESFYNGKAGSAWVSPERSAAFEYASLPFAQHRAMQFNKMTAIHGLRFVAVALEPASENDAVWNVEAKLWMGVK